MDIVFVPLKNSTEYAMIDAEDDDRVSQYSWRVQMFNGKPVPVTQIDGRQVRLNRFVLGCTPGDGYFVAPDSGDFLDCRKENLSRVEAPFDPSNSWKNRKKQPRPRFTFTPKSENSDCNHPVFTLTDMPGVYICVRCDQIVSITST